MDANTCALVLIMAAGGGILWVAQILDNRRKKRQTPIQSSDVFVEEPITQAASDESTPTRMPTLSPETIVKSYRSWGNSTMSMGWIALGIGIVSVFTALTRQSTSIPVMPTITLVVVGAMMLYYREPVMHAVFALAVFIDMVPGILVQAQPATGIWSIIRFTIILALGFEYFTVRRLIRQYTDLSDEFKITPVPDRARHLFPQIGLVSGIAILGLIGINQVIVFLPIDRQLVFSILTTMWSMIVRIGVLVFSISFTSLLVGFPRRGYSVIGALIGGGVVVWWIWALRMAQDILP